MLGPYLLTPPLVLLLLLLVPRLLLLLPFSVVYRIVLVVSESFPHKFSAIIFVHYKLSTRPAGNMKE